jgi:DNA transformation protein
MSPISPQQAFANHAVEQLRGLGPVQARRMFGGFGLFLDGLMFALIVKEQLYFKVDDTSRLAFVARGLGPFTYEARGKRQSVSYYEAPAEAFDAPDAMLEWARPAFACALRSANKKPNAPAKRTRRATAGKA